MADQLPKIKGFGLIRAHASTGEATKRASDYDVAFISGLAFRNSDAKAAVCVTPTSKDPRVAGLHLSTEAALELSAELTYAAASNYGAVEIVNRKDRREQLWQRFSSADAVMLADRLAAVAGV